MAEPSDRVREVVEELAQTGSSGFLASHVAERADVALPSARRGLTDLVGQGDLEVRYEIVCPDNGRSIATYSSFEEVPLGQEIHDAKCDTDEPFEIAREDVWIRFLPSQQLLLRMNREAADQPKKKLRGPNLRQAATNLLRSSPN